MNTSIAGLKGAAGEVEPPKPGEDDTMAALHGPGQSSAVGPNLVGELAASFVDVLYKV